MPSPTGEWLLPAKGFSCPQCQPTFLLQCPPHWALPSGGTGSQSSPSPTPAPAGPIVPSAGLRAQGLETAGQRGLSPGQPRSAELGPQRYSRVPQPRHLPLPSEGQGWAQVGMGLAHRWSESSCEAQAKRVWGRPAGPLTPGQSLCQAWGEEPVIRTLSSQVPRLVRTGAGWHPGPSLQPPTYTTPTTVASFQGSLCRPAVCLKLRAFPSRLRLRDGSLCSAVWPPLPDSGPQVLPGGLFPSPQVWVLWSGAQWCLSDTLPGCGCLWFSNLT